MEQIPLATKLRPECLDEFIGQLHLVGVNKPLAIAIKKKHLFSMIFWGPPGVGKTTLARIYAQALQANFVELSAVSAGKADIKKVIDESDSSRPTVLFLDEIHRFNKAQQDYLLPHVEKGTLTLIGATTENPSFEVIAPLLSRCRVFILNELSHDEISLIIDRALSALAASLSSSSPLPVRPLAEKRGSIQIDIPTRDWLIAVANGDARQIINLLDNCFRLYKKITLETLKNTLQSRFLRFDKQGEEHYNTISAFIKSMRASNVDAALYYLARLVDSGEDPLFIARRMVIFASEDVASPTALVVANAVFAACQQIGYPECQENLAAGTVYLAQAPKDRRAYDAYIAALNDVKKFGNLPIPLELRNPTTKLMKKIGYGKDYETCLPAGRCTTEKNLLPDQLKSKRYFKTDET